MYSTCLSTHNNLPRYFTHMGMFGDVDNGIILYVKKMVLYVKKVVLYVKLLVLCSFLLLRPTWHST